MIPIYEQSAGHGIGYTIPDFLDRFRAICTEHLKTSRAKAFAFVLYDFSDSAVRGALRDGDGFTQLDRLAGAELSVFYLHDTDRPYVPKFNAKFLELLGASDIARTPCVVFFRMENRGITDTSVANLDSQNLVTSFHELYDVLKAFRDRAALPRIKVLRVIASAAKSIGFDAVGALLAEGVVDLF